MLPLIAREEKGDRDKVPPHLGITLCMAQIAKACGVARVQTCAQTRAQVYIQSRQPLSALEAFAILCKSSIGLGWLSVASVLNQVHLEAGIICGLVLIVSIPSCAASALSAPARASVCHCDGADCAAELAPNLPHCYRWRANPMHGPLPTGLGSAWTDFCILCS